jgi:hypothetical protein
MMRSWALPLSSWRWGLGGLLEGHGFVCAQAEPAIVQQGDRLIQSTGSTVGRGLGERDTELSGGWVGQGDDPPRGPRQGDRVGKDSTRTGNAVSRAVQDREVQPRRLTTCRPLPTSSTSL